MDSPALVSWLSGFSPVTLGLFGGLVITLLNSVGALAVGVGFGSGNLGNALTLLLLIVPVVSALPQASLATEADILEFEEAFDRFRGDHSGLPLSEVDTLEVGTVRQLTPLQNRYGPSIDFVFLGSESIEKALMQHLYLVRYHNHALRVRFVYYDNGAVRRLNSFSWDDSVDALCTW